MAAIVTSQSDVVVSRDIVPSLSSSLLPSLLDNLLAHFRGGAGGGVVPLAHFR